MALGTDQLRRDNIALVLGTLRRLGPATRAELAQRTGLAKATIGAVVADLDAAGAVVEGDARQATRGRPGRPIALSGLSHVGLGLEVNVDYVAGVTIDLTGQILDQATRPVEEHDRVETLLDLARTLTATTSRLVGATIAVPGLVREDDRTIAWAPNLSTRGTDLADRLSRALPGCEVRVSNDANCAAVAEAHHGAALGVENALYLTGTVGIGAGIILGGDLLQGAAGFAGEVGHLPIGDSDAVCGCGRRGCWEAQIGLHALLGDLGVPETADPVTTAAGLAERASDDVRVRDRLTRLGEDLGLGLAVLTSVLDPEVVVLGGYFVPLWEHLESATHAVLDARLASAVQRRPELRPSVLGTHAAALGAAEQSLTGVLTGRF